MIKERDRTPKFCHMVSDDPTHPLRTWEKANATLRKAVALCIGFGCFLNIVQLGLPLFSMQIFDRVLPSAQLSSLYLLAAMLVFATAIATVIDASKSIIMARSAQRIAAVIGEGSSKSRSPQTTQLQAIDEDLSALRSFIAGPVIGGLVEIPWAFVCGFILYQISAWMGIFTAASIAIFVLTTEVVRQFTKQDLSDYRRSEMAFSEASKALSGQRLLLAALGILPGAIDRTNEIKAEVLSSHAQYYYRTAWSDALIRTIRTLMQVGIMTLSATLAVRHTVNPGAIVASSMLFARALSPFERLAPQISSVCAAVDSWKRINLFALTTGTCSPSLRTPTIEGRIRIENVSVQGDRGRRPRLTNIFFGAEPGELHLIMGDEGAGKSTFAELLCGAVLPSQGVVHLDGMSLANYDQRQLAEQIGYLPDGVIRRTSSISAMISRESGLDSEAITLAATMAGIDGIIRELPHSYQTEVSESSKRLSGGQIKRLAFARAIYKLPKVLILDEPLHGLDTVGENCIISALHELKQKGCTIVIVSKSPMFLHLADKAWVLQGGEIHCVLTGGELRSQSVPRGVTA